MKTTRADCNMDAQDVQRYTALFQNALVYTVSMSVLDDIVSTSNITALPVVIITVIGVVALVVQATAYVATCVPPALQSTSSIAKNAAELVITLLRLTTDVLVQFSGQAVSRIVMHAFTNTKSNSAAFSGIVIGVSLLHALTRAAQRTTQ